MDRLDHLRNSHRGFRLEMALRLDLIETPDMTTDRPPGPYRAIHPNPDGVGFTYHPLVAGPVMDEPKTEVPKVQLVTDAPVANLTGYAPGAIKDRIAALRADLAAKVQKSRKDALAKLDAAGEQAAEKLAAVDDAIQQYAAKIVKDAEREAADGLQEFATFSNGDPT